jgi:hypothetical protein
VYLGLLNDNLSTAIEVIVKITAIQVNEVLLTKVQNGGGLKLYL